MKKVSILALLAIVIAVGSSFSAKFVKIPDDAWFKLNDQAKTQSEFQSNYTSQPFNVAAAYDGVKRTLSDVQNSSICPIGSVKLCAVKIDYSNTNGSDASVLDDDDFTTSHSSDILGYQLRSN